MRKNSSGILRGLWLVAFLAVAGGSGCSDNPFGGSGLFDDDDPRKEYRLLLAAAIDAPKPAQSFEIKGDGVQCFDTFDKFKRSADDAGRKAPDGYHWHHIVNQNPANKTRFGKRLHCTDNLIALPKDIHRLLSDHYQSIDEWTQGKRVRDALAPQSWQAQYDYGLDQLRKHGIAP